MPFTSLKLHPSLLKGVKELGFARPTPIQADAMPPALAGRDVLAARHDRQRKDGRVRPADPPTPDRQASRHHPRPRAHADARARGADRGGAERPRGAHPGHRGVGVRRRRHGTAGARVPERRGRHRRDPRAPAGPLHLPIREARRARDPGAGRGRPDARHGISARDPEDSASPPGQAADALLQRHDARPDPDAHPGHAQEPGQHQPRAQGGAGGGDHPGGVPGGAGAQVGALPRAAPAGRHARRRSSSPAPSTAPTGWRSTWRGTASRPTGSTATGRSRSARRRWPASRAGSTGCWSRPTSPRAGSTSRSWDTW